MIKINPMDTYDIEQYTQKIQQKVIINKITKKQVHDKEKIINKRRTKHKEKITEIDEFVKEANTFLNTRIKNDLEQLISGDMKTILNIYDQYAETFKKLIPKRGVKLEFSFEQKVMNYLLRDIFNYGEIISKDDMAYEITHILNVNVCPYCNREYTNTIMKGKHKVIRPDFDHYYSKSEYPIFALSLYNLIPSCKICNQKKRDKSFVYNLNMYPFEEGVEDKKVFTYELPDYRIKIRKEDIEDKYGRFLKNANILNIEEIYDGAHRDIVKNIIQKRESINEEIINIYNKQLGTTISLDKNALKLILGYTPKEDIQNMSLSKLKNDIIDALFLDF